MQTGNINNQGYLKGGLLQKIYETDIAASDSYTKILIHGNAIADATGKTVTAVGTAAVTTAQYKFTSVGASILLDGNSDYLTSADSSDWYFGTGDFTVDVWIRFNSVTGTQDIVGQYVNDNNRWEIQYTGGLLYFYVVSGGTNTISHSVSWSPSTNIWYHVAIVRTSTTFKTFINGTQIGSDTTDTDEVPDIGSSLYIGSKGGIDYYFNGWMQELRVSKGIARWTIDFSVPTSPYDGATTSLTLAGLDGDMDIIYLLLVQGISNGSAVMCTVRINNDSTSAHYGYQYTQASNSTISASQGTNTNFYGTYNGSNNGVAYMQSFYIYAKSGYIRTSLMQGTDGISGTTVLSNITVADVWNNTADNITSLVIGNQTNVLGVGTHIELWTLKKHS